MNLEAYLRKYCSGVYPMHMPGHKRNPEYSWVEKPYEIDVTEVPGTDNLHCPEGVLLDSMEKCAKLFGAKRAFYLINGSSGGLLSAIHAALPYGGKVIMSQICHRAVYNGLQLRNGQKVFILPERDEAFNVTVSITPEQIEKCLASNPDARLVIITSPTYEGVISDIKGIARVCHKRGVPLLVDGAHGAHLPFMENNGKSKDLGMGCLSAYDEPDIIVLSLHKTLPSPTQTSVLLLNGDLISPERMQEGLSVFQTTSPSYILMAGIDRCVSFLDSDSGKLAFKEYDKMLEAFSEKIKGAKGVRVLCHGEDKLENHRFFGFDRGKLIAAANNGIVNGFELDKRLLNEYGIQIEAPFKDYIIAMTSICDTWEGLEKFADAIIAILGEK